MGRKREEGRERNYPESLTSQMSFPTWERSEKVLKKRSIKDSSHIAPFRSAVENFFHTVETGGVVNVPP